MPSTKENASPVAEQIEHEKPVESGENVDPDYEDEPEEVMDEETEYEEVEEVEEIEVEEEVEVEEAEEENGVNDQRIGDGTEVEDDNEEQQHAELLRLPPHGSEVFVGGIPSNASEAELKDFFESIGEVTEVRIAADKDSSEKKGYGFVTFKTVDMASRAISELHNAEFKGKKVKCSLSQAKHQLFLGNIPKHWREEDLRNVVNEVGPGVTTVELMKDMKTSSNNRGFAFIEYYNNACAEYSRQKMMDSKFRLGDHTPVVRWANPKNAESSASSQVKVLYVKNLPKTVTQDQLQKLFEHHGKITKIVLPPAKSGQENNRIGFVHFAERSSVMNALKNTETYELDGQVLEYSLAKPQTEQKPFGWSNSQKPGLLPGYPPGVGCDLLGSTYSTFGAGYGAEGFAQPYMYGGGTTPSGMAMMPMLLPDGRIGYILQQPGVQLETGTSYQRNTGRGGGRGSNRSGSYSNRGRHENDGSHGNRYSPY
ncbi:hypothetical protein Tsubulata_010224 [Turnera subulata]|uniref:RRM domain-containing protein n=1 Tax=Turnera subulata TaxID=218843 RepID=A0A9Q0GE46_9ROSI|nr:hypothetical protein Tsubulata_010224 [Turnera subulata]